MGKSKELFKELESLQIEMMAKAESGEVGFLDAALYLRGFNDFGKKLATDVKDFEKTYLHQIETESEHYKKDGYLGYGFAVSAKTDYDYSEISEIADAEKEVKRLKEMYKTAFTGVQKGTTAIHTEEDGVKYWITPDGEMKKFVTPKISASSLTVTVKKGKKK